MDWRRCLVPTIITTLMVAFVGFMVISVFIIPIQANCIFTGAVPADAPVKLSMNDWIFGSMISGIILFTLMASFSKQSKSNSNCLVIMLIILLSLYCLYQIVWTVIGFLLFQHFYREACSYDETFNTLITAQLVYGAVLFPIIVILGVILLIKIIIQETSNQARAPQQANSQQPLIHQQENIAAPNQLPQADQSSNAYRNIFNRLSRSFGRKGNEGIN